MAKIRNSKWQILLVAVVLILMAALAVMENREKPEPASQETAPTQVSVVKTTLQDVPVSFEFVAQTQSSQLVKIQARVNGYLEKRLYTEGLVVQAGQPLFQLDAKPFEADLAKALATLSQQKATYESTNLNYLRTKALAAEKVVTQKDLDDATGARLAALAAVEQASAQVQTAKLNLSYTLITSPVTGVGGSARQPDGSYVSQGNSLLTDITVLSPIWVNFSLSESEMLRYRDQIAKGLLQPPPNLNYTVEVILGDGSLFPHKGEITFAEPSFNAQTGTFLVRTSMENPDSQLHPNQNVHVRLSGARRPNSILVPQRAVQESARGQFVWVVGNDNQAEQRPVTVGKWHGDDWFIQEGLKADEMVIVDGSLRLQPGMAVNPTPYVPENSVKLESQPQSGERQ